MIVAKERVRVLVVEAALEIAELVRRLEADGDIEVVGSTIDAAEVVALVEQTRPDVVTVDLALAGSDARNVIEEIMGYVPTPVLALSAAVSDRQSAQVIDALMAGALDALPRPRRWSASDEVELRRRVRVLNGTPVIRHPRARLRSGGFPRDTSGEFGAPRVVVAIAASTGGPPALAAVVAGLGDIGAPVLLVQHIHPNFVGELGAWLQRVSPFPIGIAQHGEPLQPNVGYLAPGGTHLRVSAHFRVVLDPKPDVPHRPSADELFFSMARLEGAHSVAALLTGMGDDGAEGLLAIRQSGGFTIAQDAETSAVYGMPAAAARLGAARSVLPLDQVAKALRDASRVGRR